MDILLRHGTILDARIGKTHSGDILITDGVITEIGDAIVPKPGTEIVELEGAYVSDGWVESHTHIDWEAGQTCLDPNMTYPCDGITYVLDAGTNGPNNYHIVHDKIASMAIRAKAYLYVAVNGTCMAGNELKSNDLLDEDAFRKTYEQYKDEIIGVKIRIDPRVNFDILGTLARSRKLADEVGLPLIIHPTRCPESLETILPYLKKNDVFAHTYSALAPCILDEKGVVKACVREARDRGVWFDLSHGSSNFSFEIAKKAMEQGFVIDTISTDLHTANITGPVRSMADTMSKMLYLGMPLEEIIYRVTVTPMEMLGLKDKILGIETGRTADLTVFRVERGHFTLRDSYKKEVAAEQRITPVLTIYGNQMFSPRNGIFMN